MSTDSIIKLILANGPRRGKDLRNILVGAGIRMSAPSFYLKMSKLVDSGAVFPCDKTIEIDGVEVKERWFYLK